MKHDEVSTPMRLYHAFWRNPYEGYKVNRLSTPSETEVAELRKKQDEAASNVCDLIVIYGIEVEFEPVSIVKSYRVKDF